MKHFTLEEIGKLAGVSRSTASRVINNHPSVSPEVRARVEQVIAETGYVPNSAARSLASSRTGIIGLIFPANLRTNFTDAYFAEMISGITDPTNHPEYTVALYIFHTLEQEYNTVRQMVSGRMVDGLIITTDSKYSMYKALEKQYNVPIVQIGRNHREDISNIHYVDVDNMAGGYLATSHLIQLGHTRVGHLGVEDNSAGIARAEGYRKALRHMGIAYDDNLVVNGDFTKPSGYKAMKHLLNADPPSAIFAASDLMAIGAITAIEEAGLRVPDDIAIVGFDDFPIASTFSVPLTTIRHPIFRQGIVLMDTMVEIINTSTHPARHTILPIELIVRASSS